MNKKIISSEKRPTWQIILAAMFYTGTIYIIYLVFQYWSIRWIAVGNKLLTLGITTFYGGLFFSSTKAVVFVEEKKTISIEYFVGRIKYHTFYITDLKYISVFNNYSTELLEINLWYKQNKHINLAIFNDLKLALEYGLEFSNKLNIDLLDATEKGNSKWVEK